MPQRDHPKTTTPLARRLIRQITEQGPISVADYMRLALSDPKDGYYTSGQPFGRSGDFVTAPEISQMFGELIGLWCVDTWRRLGAPAPLLLVELGPGRGTLMADALRAARLDPAFLAAVRLHLVEISRPLRALQAERLAPVQPTWHDDLASLPEGPLLVIANEFFDALPVIQFERGAAGWCERLVGLDGSGALAFQNGPPRAAAPALLPAELRDGAPGSLAEVAPDAIELAAEIARRVVTGPGSALVIDYGQEGAGGHSLQAVRDHNFQPVLADPGRADLSAAVDFARLARVAAEAGALAHGPIDQGRLLMVLGIDQRTEALCAQATADQAREIAAARRRLCHPTAMGHLFKALAIGPPGLGPPAGFP